MTTKFILFTCILLAGCNKETKQKKINFSRASESSRTTKNRSNREAKTNPVSKVEVTYRAPAIIQSTDKVYKSLQGAGISLNNLDFFFHANSNFRELMLEKLLNTRDPYHQHLVWNRLKQMLAKDQWEEGFDRVITVLWQSSDASSRKNILNYLIMKPTLMKVGRTPWTASKWLLNLKINTDYELVLLKALKDNQHPSRPWVRNYLSKRYGKNFGSNYLIWKQFLEQN